jgi:hypothetical protein
MMVNRFPALFRAGCLAGILLFVSVFAADPKSPLLGLNRDQLIERLGEPKSQLAGGGRVIMVFAGERVVLRDGVVVEVEILPPEAPPRRAAPVAEPEPAPVAAPPAAPQPTAPAVSPRTAAPEPAEPSPQSVPPAATASTTTAAAPEPQLSIKQVRPPGAPRATPKQAPAVTPAALDASATKSQPTPSPTVSTVPAPNPAPSPTPAPTSGSNSLVAPGTASTMPSTVAVVAPSATEPAATEPPVADKADEPVVEKKQVKTSRRYTNEPDIPEVEETIYSGRNIVMVFIVIGTGLGFLMWQRRQRALELAATAVSRTPFTSTTPATGGAMFPASLLGELEWKRFEELVEAYYSKTGVVAARTKTGPASPVHIKISWKGEPRPFACVQCIAHPSGLIDATRIQELFAVLSAEDIRRGYVVTTGKFSVAARDFAEEKHITLMSGDIFLEKINALPPSARAELIQEFSAGDFKTPSCPKCDARMVPSAEDPGVWVCKVHADVKIPAWK